MYKGIMFIKNGHIDMVKHLDIFFHCLCIVYKSIGATKYMQSNQLENFIRSKVESVNLKSISSISNLVKIILHYDSINEWTWFRGIKTAIWRNERNVVALSSKNSIINCFEAQSKSILLSPVTSIVTYAKAQYHLVL